MEHSREVQQSPWLSKKPEDLLNSLRFLSRISGLDERRRKWRVAAKRRMKVKKAMTDSE